MTLHKCYFRDSSGTILSMIKTPWYGELAMRLNRASSTPLSRQIYSEMAHRILSGELKPGSRIPSGFFTRRLRITAASGSIPASTS